MANERHGLDACVYLGDTPSKLAVASGWTINITGEECEVVRFEDTWKTLLRGIMSGSGSITAYHDQEAKILAALAQTGDEEVVVLYPDCSDKTTYYHGVAYFDFSHTADVGSCQTQTAPFRISGPVNKVGFS
ncbi:unnamed protein product [marine sediment metagenome]|uniref:Uncharacterized protein n=1 Tax=marine sediment metagenome TaxID=412755 RepID=X1GJ60_9ZZZZ